MDRKTVLVIGRDAAHTADFEDRLEERGHAVLGPFLKPSAYIRAARFLQPEAAWLVVDDETPEIADLACELARRGVEVLLFSERAKHVPDVQGVVNGGSPFLPSRTVLEQFFDGHFKTGRAAARA